MVIFMVYPISQLSQLGGGGVCVCKNNIKLFDMEKNIEVRE